MFTRIETREQFHIAGTVVTCRYENTSEVMADTWPRFLKMLPEITAAIRPDLQYGLAEDRKEDFTYWIGVQIPSPEQAPEGATVTTVPTEEYAVFEHRGPVEQIRDTYTYIYGTWLPQSEYERAPKRFFELYGPAFVQNGPERENSVMEIYIPIQKRA